MTLIIFLMLTYFFALIVYFNYYMEYETEDGEKPCIDLLPCYIYIIDRTFKVT